MTTTLQPQTLIARSPTPLSAEVQGDVVLMSLERGQYYGLDDIASDIWRRLESPRSVADLCAALAADYSADAATIQTDVLALLEQMLGYGLIVLG